MNTCSEFLLRPANNSPHAAVPPVESVTFRPENPDDHGFNRAIRNISIPTLTVYRPADVIQNHPAMVICPGGGYETAVIDREGHAIARYFTKRGFTVAVLKYRMPGPETFHSGLPVSQQDALEAIRFMRRHAADWNFNQVGIMGFSAGGHLAGSSAVFGDSADGSRPDFAALLYPVVTMNTPHLHQGSRDRLLGSMPSAGRIKEFSLECRTSSNLPPFFIAHAKDDSIVPFQNSTMLADALKAAGVPVELMLVNTGEHGFSLGRDPNSSQWKDRFLTWIDGLS